jgi:NAD(P)-dependent dehydrogenase (short-subunit alcohol dehydrogenase family)
VETLQRVADECRAAGAEGVLVQATDIADSGEAFGRFEDVPVEVFDNIIRTNLIGAANVARSALSQYHQSGTGHLARQFSERRSVRPFCPQGSAPRS